METDSGSIKGAANGHVGVTMASLLVSSIAFRTVSLKVRAISRAFATRSASSAFAAAARRRIPSLARVRSIVASAWPHSNREITPAGRSASKPCRGQSSDRAVEDHACGRIAHALDQSPRHDQPSRELRKLAPSSQGREGLRDQGRGARNQADARQARRVIRLARKAERAILGMKPITSQWQAGFRIEPPLSVPMFTSARLRAAATPVTKILIARQSPTCTTW